MVSIFIAALAKRNEDSYLVGKFLSTSLVEMIATRYYDKIIESHLIADSDFIV
jgi:hypothetical protein